MISRPMTDADWELFYPYFTKTEKWGKPEYMDFRFIHELWDYRRYIGKRINIHCGYEESGHTKYSLHGKSPCNAVDFDVEDMHPVDQFLSASKFGFNGIGLYPCWNRPGIHCEISDTRSQGGYWWRRDWWEWNTEKKEWEIKFNYPDEGICYNQLPLILQAEPIGSPPKGVEV